MSTKLAALEMLRVTESVCFKWIVGGGGCRESISHECLLLECVKDHGNKNEALTPSSSKLLSPA